MRAPSSRSRIGHDGLGEGGEQQESLGVGAGVHRGAEVQVGLAGRVDVEDVHSVPKKIS